VRPFSTLPKSLAYTVLGNKGSELEETLKAYFLQAGYFVARAVPFRLEDEDVTDIDLWLYERPAALTRRRLIVDAKNRKSPKVSERIIWTKGLTSALSVDGAIVATTDKRESARKLAKALGITLLDGDAIRRLQQSEHLRKSGQIGSDELDAAIKRIDGSRRSSEWRQRLQDARSSMITGFGVPSANKNLAASSFFAEQAIIAQPHSESAQIALRSFYLVSALAAISLDYLVADQAFRSHDERRQSVAASIRYGESEAVGVIPLIGAAIALARRYADNGGAAAKQIEHGYHSDAARIPAEIIADHVARIASSDTLFNAAREMDRASFAPEVLSYDILSNEAKSLLGVFLDFNGISREKIAMAWPVGWSTSKAGRGSAHGEASLFDEAERAQNTEPKRG
jgi:hypothetical protein